MKKILIADDEHKIIMTLEYTFRKAGYEVFIARDGSEVLELLKEETPDIILLDFICENIYFWEKVQAFETLQILNNIPNFWKFVSLGFSHNKGSPAVFFFRPFFFAGILHRANQIQWIEN